MTADTNSGGGLFGAELCRLHDRSILTQEQAQAAAAENPRFRPFYSVECDGWHVSTGGGRGAQQRRRERRAAG